MSASSIVALGASIVLTAGVIYLVQVKQEDDRRRMHEGVIRDKERQQRKKVESAYYLEQQAELAKRFKKENRDDQALMKLLADEKDGQ
ncbi:UNVERIFIED_CONTAM: hypothetical protein PYX00_006867 [Menopon gallinae]|uniref:Uncharacterized protein n=1 Tax=Menopon gallinae TaxID=328185 RepID=A0AAW2HYF1_9NEOP